MMNFKTVNKDSILLHITLFSIHILHTIHVNILKAEKNMFENDNGNYITLQSRVWVVFSFSSDVTMA